MSSIKSFCNRGMLLEQIINKSIDFYIRSKIAFFRKQNLNVKFQEVNKNNNSIKNGYIYSKSTVDYYGIYKGRYVCFEAKSTELDYLPLNNIYPHQKQHLKFISNLGGWAFYLVYFKKYNQIFLVDIKTLDIENKKTISLKEIASCSFKLDLIFPGIIDFLSCFPE